MPTRALTSCWQRGPLTARTNRSPARSLRHLWFDHPGVRLEADTVAAVGPDGSLVGAVAVVARDAPTTIARAFIPGDNPTGAVRVCATLGFRPSEESIIYSRRI